MWIRIRFPKTGNWKIADLHHWYPIFAIFMTSQSYNVFFMW
jgi:hypothetical protein